MRHLRLDTLTRLFAADYWPLRWMAERELLRDCSAPASSLWDSPDLARILARQRPDGGWRYSGGNPAIRSEADYDQLETYRQLGVLVAKFALDCIHPAVASAAKFLGSFQTDAGDYRGIYGNQYSPNYSAAITELLINAGYGNSPQVQRALRWLLSMRQEDGGWAIPTRTLGVPLKAMLTTTDTLEPDRGRPSSHLVTGIVVRALAADARLCRSAAAHRAGELLKKRFFARDAYPDRAAASYWLVFSYPFWWTDLLSALDSLTRMGFKADDPDIARGLDWFLDNQEPNGLWNTGRNRPKDPCSDLWVALAVCRVVRRSLGSEAIRAARTH